MLACVGPAAGTWNSSKASYDHEKCFEERKKYLAGVYFRSLIEAAYQAEFGIPLGSDVFVGQRARENTRRKGGSQGTPKD